MRLERALEMRRQLGDEAGRAVTEENLMVLRTVARPPWWNRNARLLAAAGAGVVAVAVAVAVIAGGHGDQGCQPDTDTDGDGPPG